MVARGKDLTGKVYNMVTVVERRGNDKWGNANYLCRCECGKEFERLSQHIRDPKVISCGCYKKRRGPDSKSWKGFGVVGAAFMNRITKHSKRRGIIFDLTCEYLNELFIEQNERCALSGVKLTMPLVGNKYKVKGNASVDRIDSNRGYVEGNVQWVHRDINFMKQQFSQEHFIEMCEKVVRHNNRNT